MIDSYKYNCRKILLFTRQPLYLVLKRLVIFHTGALDVRCPDTVIVHAVLITTYYDINTSQLRLNKLQ